MFVDFLFVLSSLCVTVRSWLLCAWGLCRVSGASLVTKHFEGQE